MLYTCRPHQGYWSFIASIECFFPILFISGAQSIMVKEKCCESLSGYSSTNAASPWAVAVGHVVEGVPKSSQSQAGMVQFPEWLQQPTRRDRQMGMPRDHAAGLQRQMVPGREPHCMWETETWIGMPWRVTLDIYLDIYLWKGRRGRRRRTE